MSAQETFQVYPNPTKTVISIDVEVSSACTALVYVYDITGKVVMEQLIHDELVPGKNTFSLNVAPLKQGTYFVKVVAGDQLFTTNMIIRR